MSKHGEIFARYRPLVDDWEAFLAALARPLPVCVWANPLCIPPEALASWMRSTEAEPEPLGWLPEAFRLPSGFAPGNRLEHLTGLYHVQEEVSLLPGVLLDPRPGERVLDLCAAPGGKTARLAAAMANRGTVVANDRDLPRLTTLRANLDRLGVLAVTTTAEDGSNYPPASGSFDRVLVDAPCTCEGTCRKNPEVLGQVGVGGSRRMSRPQRALLRKAVQLCRPGGRIVYSTCTWAPEENELVVAEVLAEQVPGTLRLLPARVPGFTASPGLTAWEGRELPPELAGCLRVWPHQNDTGGFFVAVLEKGGSAQARPDGAAELEGTLPAAAPVDPWRPYLIERFGLNEETFADLHVFRHSRRRLAVAPRDHQPPRRPEPYTVGLPFLHSEMAVPKLTTVAARLVGAVARRNVVETDGPQARAYLGRRPFLLTPEQVAAVTGRGHVIVRHGEAVLGLGQMRVETAGGVVESLLPKRWAAVAAAPGFGGIHPRPHQR